MTMSRSTVLVAGDECHAGPAADFEQPILRRVLHWAVGLGKWPHACSYFMRDMLQYMRYSATLSASPTERQLEGRIIATYHIIEKGLTLPETRVGYGQAAVRSLLGFMREYRLRGFDLERVSIQGACGALRAYVAYHDEAGYDLGSLRTEILRETLVTNPKIGGVLPRVRAAIQQSGRGNFEELVKTRHSIRDFASERVCESLIQSAISIAIRTPSVCNRQCWRAYWVCSARRKAELFKLLSGCRGFGDSADSFLVITSDLQLFSGVTERNQAFIDGGMFAMSLLYALHYLGLGTCCLNWVTLAETDERAHAVLEVPKSERILMAIAVGHLREEFHVTCSARRPVSEVLSVR
jgi:nitroreductase